MIISLEIRDNDYKNISDYCQKNNLILEHYLTDKIISGYTVDKYGAVPPMFANKATNVTTVEVESKPSTKKTNTVLTEEVKTDIKNEVKPNTQQTTSKQKAVTEGNNESLVKPKPTRVKRTLKSK